MQVKSNIRKSNIDFTRIRESLSNEGYFIHKNYPVTSDITVGGLGNDLVEICSNIGIPMPHDRNGKIVWDIKSTKASKGSVITYSEHNHEADLHTDSQYSEYPEDYFALLTIKKAQCGGGQSYILKLRDIITELMSTKEGKRARIILENTLYPFIVPNIFKKDTKKEVEIVFGKILENDQIRFRVDTIQKAIDYDPSLCTSDQIDAFNLLVDLVRNTQYTNKFFLEEGDLIFINNKTTLHGRSSFIDTNRHLLRVRMNKRSL